MYTYKLGGMLITDELYHDDLEAVTFGRKDQNELMHYGIKGQSWGKRRFQNEDGSLTAAGRNRYDVGAPLTGTTAANMSKNLTYKTWNGSSNGYGGASGGGGSVTPKGSPTMRTYGSGITNGGKSYSYESHRGPGQSAGRTITNKVKAKVNSTVDSGRKAADNLFGRIGNWATNAYNDASKAVTGAANAAGNWAGNAAKDVGNWASNAVNDVGRTATNIYNDASKAVGNAANSVNNATNEVSSWFSDGSKEREKLGKTRHDDEMIGTISRDFMKKNYPDEYDQFVKDQDSAKQARAQAVDDYMNFSNNPVNTVSRALNLPNKKGNWAYAVPGNEQYLDKFDEKWIPKTENIADWFTGNNYSNAQDTRNGYANEWDAKADEIRSYNNPNLDRFVEDTNRYASEQREYADALNNMYNNAPRQKINSALDAAGNWIGDRAKDVGNFATNAANDVGRTVGNAANAAGDWVGDRAKDVGNFATNAANAAGNAIGNAARDVGDWASNAASDVRDWGAGAVDSGKNFFNNLFGGGNKEPEQPTLSDPNERIITENIIPEQRITEQRIPEQRITEQRIPEQRITEQRIPEQRITENRIEEQRMAEKQAPGGFNSRPLTKEENEIELKRVNNRLNNIDDYYDHLRANNNPQWSNYTKQDIIDLLTKDRDRYQNKINQQQEAERARALSNKPDGVSDEYWREYTFNGGTRDSYDREMNARKNSAVSLSSDKDYAAEQKRLRNIAAQQDRNGFRVEEVNAPVGTVDTSRPYHFTYDPASGQTIVVYDDEKRR